MAGTANGYVNFTTCTWNSLKITINNIIGNVVSCTLAAYAFARSESARQEFLLRHCAGDDAAAQ